MDDRDEQGRRVRSRGGTLILLRHGQSESNASEEFSGWLDVALTARGEHEATRAATMLTLAAILPEVVHTSVLTRAIHSARIVLAGMHRDWVPCTSSWRLNERHYGALQGRSKAAVRVEVGDDVFRRWRRSFRDRPPALPEGHPSAASRDPRYRLLPPDALPSAESLADVQSRLLPYWFDTLAADVYAGRVPLVVAHGNSIRALVMHLDHLSEAQVETLNIPTGVPLVYELDADLRPLRVGGLYLDLGAAQAGAAEVAAQGQAK